MFNPWSRRLKGPRSFWKSCVSSDYPALSFANKKQLCPDARLREEMLEGDPEDIPVVAMTPTAAQQALANDPGMAVNIEALAKAVGRSPLDLTILVSRRTSTQIPSI